MRSQASFTIDNNSIELAVKLLGERLSGFKYKVEKSGMLTSRVYAYSDEGELATFRSCKNIQSKAVFDSTKELL